MQITNLQCGVSLFPNPKRIITNHASHASKCCLPACSGMYCSLWPFAGIAAPFKFKINILTVARRREVCPADREVFQRREPFILGYFLRFTVESTSEDRSLFCLERFKLFVLIW